MVVCLVARRRVKNHCGVPETHSQAPLQLVVLGGTSRAGTEPGESDVKRLSRGKKFAGGERQVHLAAEKSG